MNEQPTPAFEDRMETLRREILKWNRKINLVSRVATENRLDALLEECERAWRLMRARYGNAPWFLEGQYVDLGSGAGLPGLVWAAAREREGYPGAVFLVEPRGKRAWFLQRTTRQMSLQRVTVVRERWEARTLPDSWTPSQSVLFSLKALKLSDGEILKALTSREPPGEVPVVVAIVRFLSTGAGPDLDDRASQRTIADDAGSPYRMIDRDYADSGRLRLRVVRYQSQTGSLMNDPR
ncbi:MAG: class I SAM-dependent methyltransferase [Candidatus Krumholzibacteria bacterium]|nr:class I SAM-dependent methyltransferase [Candidatus Krumholzibacteria bacterium]